MPRFCALLTRASVEASPAAELMSNICSQVYGSACQTTLQKLNVVHNTALRICTGAYKTSPVESLYVDSGFPLLFIRREELGLRYMSKILSSKLNPNFKFVKEPIDRAPNRPRLPKPFEVRLVDSARTIGLLPPSVAEVCPQKFPPWARPNISICPARGDKKLSSDIQLKANFLRACFRSRRLHQYLY